MHIEDGILSPQAWGTWYAASAVFIIPGITQIKRRVEENSYYKPFLAMVGVGGIYYFLYALACTCNRFMFTSMWYTS